MGTCMAMVKERPDLWIQVYPKPRANVPNDLKLPSETLVLASR